MALRPFGLFGIAAALGAVGAKTGTAKPETEEERRQRLQALDDAAWQAEEERRQRLQALDDAAWQAERERLRRKQEAQIARAKAAAVPLCEVHEWEFRRAGRWVESGMVRVCKRCPATEPVKHRETRQLRSRKRKV